MTTYTIYFKCKSHIAGLVKTGSTCSRSFHLGCCKAYLTHRNAITCCVTELSSHKTEISDSLSNDNMDQTESGVTTNSLLQTILAKINDTAAKIDKSDAKLSAFIMHQDAVNADFSSELRHLLPLYKTITEHGERISALEKQNTHIISNAKSSESGVPSVSAVLRRYEIVISGLLTTVSDSPKIIVEKVFLALGIPELTTDVLEIQAASRKLANGDHVSMSKVITNNVEPASSSNRPQSVKTSLFVALKSHEVSEFIVKVMRNKRTLTLAKVFPSNDNRHVYVYEALPSDTYHLLLKIK